MIPADVKDFAMLAEYCESRLAAHGGQLEPKVTSLISIGCCQAIHNSLDGVQGAAVAEAARFWTGAASADFEMFSKTFERRVQNDIDQGASPEHAYKNRLVWACLNKWTDFDIVAFEYIAFFAKALGIDPVAIAQLIENAIGERPV